jgi:hypothetical protein
MEPYPLALGCATGEGRWGFAVVGPRFVGASMPVQVGEGVAGGCEVGRGGGARAGKLQVVRRAAASRSAVPAPAARQARKLLGSARDAVSLKRSVGGLGPIRFRAFPFFYASFVPVRDVQTMSSLFTFFFSSLNFFSYFHVVAH